MAAQSCLSPGESLGRPMTSEKAVTMPLRGHIEGGLSGGKADATHHGFLILEQLTLQSRSSYLLGSAVPRARCRWYTKHSGPFCWGWGQLIQPQPLELQCPGLFTEHHRFIRGNRTQHFYENPCVPFRLSFIKSRSVPPYQGQVDATPSLSADVFSCVFHVHWSSLLPSHFSLSLAVCIRPFFPLEREAVSTCPVIRLPNVLQVIAVLSQSVSLFGVPLIASPRSVHTMCQVHSLNLRSEFMQV